jgi:endonuclease G
MRHAIAISLVVVACASPSPTGMDPPEDPEGDPSDGDVIPDDPAPIDSPHLALGVPTDASPADDHLVVHEQMALGYNRFLNAPNWVSWRTRAEDFGPVERYQGNFYPDTQLPAEWFRADHSDMYGSGYDRGHMLRSEERTRTSGENYATFVMTNVLPQRADLNRGPWFDFELYVQRRVESTSRPRDAYVIAGAIWSPACSTHAPRAAGDGCRDVGRTSDVTRRIAVPIATWKVAVFVDAGIAPLDAAANPYVVAVVMPNETGISETRWYEYRTTVAEIERQSGYDLPSLE